MIPDPHAVALANLAVVLVAGASMILAGFWVVVLGLVARRVA